MPCNLTFSSLSSLQSLGRLWGRSGKMGSYKDKKRPERVPGVSSRLTKTTFFLKVLLKTSYHFHLVHMVVSHVSVTKRLNN